MPLKPEPRVGADDARAHRHDRDVGVRDVAGDRERREDRHRLEVAAERVPARDGGVEQARGRAASATRSDSASGRPAPSVIT